MILVDTSGLLAALDPRQTQHSAAAKVLLEPQRRILSPFVLAELDYLIGAHGGQGEALKLLNDVSRGAYQLEAFGATDIENAIRVLEQYAGLGLGLTDASIAVLAERHRCLDILTLDERHFRAIRGPGGRAFRLLPADGS